MTPRLLDINTEFFLPGDRHADRERFFDRLSALGAATRAADTQYYVTTSISFEICAAFMIRLLRPTDFLKIQDVGEGDFFIMNAPPEVEAQLLNAEALDIIQITSPSRSMIAIKRAQSAALRERIRATLVDAAYAPASADAGKPAYSRPIKIRNYDNRPR